MPQTDRVAVVATHLAADRRALSEAWYSTLHLARRADRCVAAHPRARVAAGRDVLAFARSCGRDVPGGAVRSLVCGARAARMAPARPETPPRPALPALARAVARAMAQPAAARRFALPAVVRLREGRVQLHVRERGGHVEVIALCAPALRERVERALAEARVALVRLQRAEAA
ncbi:MAG: hypothetical protein JOZ24_06735 [Candidatus Eremiobacteraeota bacterium]|nr:hypothetical protein [Candidatus Eremiobacteraeota bacterium]